MNNKKCNLYADSAVFHWLPALIGICCFFLSLQRSPAAGQVTEDNYELETSINNLPENGFRHWKPFEKTPIRYDYVTGSCQDNRITYYMSCSDFKKPRKKTIMISFPPGGERNLRKIKVLFSSKLITDINDPSNPQKPANLIQMARTSMHYDPENGYVSMQSLFPGKASDYPKRSLIPGIFSSPSGKPDTWKYHGKLKGEPSDYEKDMKNKKKRWIGEGSIVPVGENRWRIYLGGYGVPLAVAQSDSLDGPWRFLKDRRGNIKNIIDKPWKGNGCFPYVLKVSENEYHVWITEKWPTGPVWHYTSENGLDFKPYGLQPEITLSAVQAQGIKGIRAFLCPDKNVIYGLIPFSKGSGWEIYQSAIPTGLQPKSQ